MTTTNSLNQMEKAGGGRRRSLRIAIITENFLPKVRTAEESTFPPSEIVYLLISVLKVDGVTRTLARLLEHLALEGHTALVMGPESGMVSFDRNDNETC